MGIKASKLSKIMKTPPTMRLGSPPALTVPKGYVPISVGVNDETAKRFVIHTTTLGHADFLEFLCRSAEEYGFTNEGILRIPCEARAFEKRMMKGAKQKMLRVRPI